MRRSLVLFLLETVKNPLRFWGSWGVYKTFVGTALCRIVEILKEKIETVAYIRTIWRYTIFDKNVHRIRGLLYDGVTAAPGSIRIAHIIYHKVALE